MPIRIVRASREIIRREGLGAEQCEACGHIYRIDHVPEVCENVECPTNQADEKPSYDSEMGQGGAGYNAVMFGNSED